MLGGAAHKHTHEQAILHVLMLALQLRADMQQLRHRASGPDRKTGRVWLSFGRSLRPVLFAEVMVLAAAVVAAQLRLSRITTTLAAGVAAAASTAYHRRRHRCCCCAGSRSHLDAGGGLQEVHLVGVGGEAVKLAPLAYLAWGAQWGLLGAATARQAGREHVLQHTSHDGNPRQCMCREVGMQTA